MYTLKLLDTSLESSKKCELLKREARFWDHLSVEEKRSPSFFDVYNLLNPKSTLFFSIFKAEKLIGFCSLIELNHVTHDLYYVSDLMVHKNEKNSFWPIKIINAIEEYLISNNRDFVIVGLENRYFALEALEKIFAKKKLGMGFNQLSHLYVLEASREYRQDSSVEISELGLFDLSNNAEQIPMLDKKYFEYLKTIDQKLKFVKMTKGKDSLEAILFSDDLLRTFEFEGELITKNNLLIIKTSNNKDLIESLISYCLNETFKSSKKFLYYRAVTENDVFKEKAIYCYVNRQFYISRSERIPTFSLGITV